MRKSKIFTVSYRRKRQGKTNYKKRLALLLSNKPRLVVRRSLKNTWAQIIIYDSKGDKVVASACSSELRKYGWNYNTGNMPAAYLTGILVGKKATKQGIKEAILDIGLYKSIKKGRLYAVLKGALETGLNLPHSEAVLPDEKRLLGEHIKAYAEQVKGKEARQFSGLIKENIDVSAVPNKVNEIKKKIMEE